MTGKQGICWDRISRCDCILYEKCAYVFGKKVLIFLCLSAEATDGIGK